MHWLRCRGEVMKWGIVVEWGVRGIICREWMQCTDAPTMDDVREFDTEADAMYAIGGLPPSHYDCALTAREFAPVAEDDKASPRAYVILEEAERWRRRYAGVKRGGYRGEGIESLTKGTGNFVRSVQTQLQDPTLENEDKKRISIAMVALRNDFFDLQSAVLQHAGVKS